MRAPSRLNLKFRVKAPLLGNVIITDSQIQSAFQEVVNTQTFSFIKHTHSITQQFPRDQIDATDTVMHSRHLTSADMDQIFFMETIRFFFVHNVNVL